MAHGHPWHRLLQTFSNDARAQAHRTCPVVVMQQCEQHDRPETCTRHFVGGYADLMQLLQSKFKLGQTIPTKFVITDATGTVVTQTSNPTFTRSGNRGNCDLTATLEGLATVAADAVAEYRLTGGQYLYGWSTKGLTAGEYRIYANLADGSSPYVDICLTK